MKILYLFLKLFSYFCKRMDSLFLLQFACFIFMLVNALFVALAMPIAIFSTTLLYIVGPAVLLALLFFNLTFIALGSSYVPTEELLDKEEENKGSSRTRYMRSGGVVRFLPKKQDHFCRVWILLSHSSLPNLQDKRRLFSYRMESLPVYRCSTKIFKLSVSIFCKKHQRKSKNFIEKQVAYRPLNVNQHL